jgi:hypothetical protein
VDDLEILYTTYITHRALEVQQELDYYVSFTEELCRDVSVVAKPTEDHALKFFSTKAGYSAPRLQ